MRKSTPYLLLLILFFSIASGLRLPGADVHSLWVGPMYGAWNEPTNWLHTPALPGADYPHNDLLTYDVEITNGYAVVYPAMSLAIESLTMGGGTLHSDYGPIIINGPLRWTEGSLYGSGTFVASNSVVVTGLVYKAVGATLKAYGPFVLSAPIFDFGGTETYGDLEFQGGGTSFGTLTSFGPVRKTDGGTNFITGVFDFRSGLDIQTGAVVGDGVTKISGNIHVPLNSMLMLPGWGSLGTPSSNMMVSGRGLLRFSGSGIGMNLLGEMSSTTDWEIQSASVHLTGSWAMKSNSVGSVRTGGLSGPGCLLLDPGCALTLYGSGIGGNLGISNRGTIRLAGPYECTGLGRVHNHGLIEYTNDVRFLDYESTSFIENHAVIRKSAGTGIAGLNALNVNNRGLVEVLAGTLSFPGGGTNTGNFRPATNAMLNFGAAAGLPVNYSAKLAFADGATFEGMGTNQIFTEARIIGNVTNLGQLELHLPRVWDPGPFGVLHNASNATIRMHSDNWVPFVLSNRGTLDLGSYASVIGGGRIENEGHAFIGGEYFFGGPLNNRALLRKVMPTTTSFQVEQLFGGSNSGLNNSGVCAVEAGTLDLKSPGTSSGTFLVSSNAWLTFQSLTNTLIEGARLAGAGNVSIGYSGTLNIEGNVTNETTLGLDYGGHLQGSGRLFVQAPGRLVWSGGELTGNGIVEIDPTGSMDIQAGATKTWSRRVINNYGVASITDANTSGHDAVLNNHASLRMTGGGSILWDGVGTRPLINNFGTMVVTGGYRTALPGSLTNSGTFQLQNTRIDLDRFYNFANASVVGTMNCAVAENRTGTMTLAAGGPSLLTNNSVLEIGNPIGIASAGLVLLGPASILNLDIGGTNFGTDFDHLLSGSRLVFDGVLNIRLTNGFQPALGQRFTIFSHDQGVSGLFSRIHGLNLGNGLRFTLEQVGKAVDLVVVPAPPAGVPPLATRRFSKIFPRDIQVSWPAGFQGFYCQTTTNLNAPWQTLFMIPSPNASYFTSVAGGTNSLQRYWRLFDPDSP